MKFIYQLYLAVEYMIYYIIYVYMRVATSCEVDHDYLRCFIFVKDLNAYKSNPNFSLDRNTEPRY